MSDTKPAAPKPLDASDFQRISNNGWSMGIAPPRVVASALVDLAGRIERGETLVHRVHVIGVAERAAFGGKRLVIELTENHAPRAEPEGPSAM